MTRGFLLLIFALWLCAALFGATERLYLKDGTYHAIREYKVEADRVRYYSTERGDWEEIPIDLVDLKRTEKEIKDREDAMKAEAAQMDEEDKAIRVQRKEVASIPMEPGVYLAQGAKIDTLKLAEVKVVNDKKRSVLKLISPIPVISGKSYVEMDGLHAEYSISDPRPEFYVRISDEIAFAIVRVRAGKNARILEDLNLLPVVNEIAEQRDVVETYRQQMADGLFKIWPTKPLEPGEYAVMTYIEGKVKIQVWDFARK